MDNLVSFDERQVELRQTNRGWQLTAGGVPLRDFGLHEAEAREALHWIHELHLNQHGLVGTPHPVLEYWLTDGHAPQTPGQELRTVALDLNSVRAEQVQGQWWVRDDSRFLFRFGQHAEDAEQALAVIRRYGFSQVGFVGSE
jgi:hypothetical protein